MFPDLISQVYFKCVEMSDNKKTKCSLFVSYVIDKVTVVRVQW